MKLTTNRAYVDNGSDLNHKDIVEVASEAKWEQSQRWTKDDGSPVNQFRVDLKLPNGEVKNTILRWTNAELLIEAFGDETKDWIGKKLRAWKTKSDRAKLGYIYLFVPTTWERDDTGEWVKNGTPDATSQEVKNTEDTVEYPEEDIDPDDIPF